jgi:type II secretory ATPase GspE/PulE/Tfp pilus assembly ATPase PilB-like protein
VSAKPKLPETKAPETKAPDTTARITREQVAAQAKAALTKTPLSQCFIWPAPPYYEFSDASKHSDECMLVFRDGAKASGTLIDFLPDEAQLKFRSRDAGESVSIAFSSLLRVQLLRPVALRRQPVRLDDTEELFAPSERQPFAIGLANGKTFLGETVGSVHALCGLFLFPPEHDGMVTRCFVPVDATRSTKIGKPIGEMLVEERLASAENVDAALSKQEAMRSRRFGDYLTEHQIVSPEQLAAALKQQRAQPIQKLGETLVELGYLTEGELEEALAIEARDRRVPLGQILADMGVVEADVVNAVMARKLGIPYVNLKNFRIAPDVLKRVPAAVAHRFQTVPVAETDNALVVAVENPMDMAKLEGLRFVTGTKLLPVMASGDDIRAGLQRFYGQAQPNGAAAAVRKAPDLGISELTHRLSAETADVDFDEQQSAAQDSTLVQLVNKMIVDAIEQKASDIHIEANAAGRNMRVRFRKDGVLVPYLDLPSKFRKAVVSRIKIMCQLDITERRKPQDGKIEFRRFGPLDVDLRVATIPTAGGLEDVVMRVLAAATPLPLAELGFEAPALDAIKRLISRPHGLFLVCGPTGSGKTTTLHSLLAFLNTAEAKIWTAEDPIEIAQPGLRQVQVNPKIGWTFAAAMRSFMRADPDVIMVGETRDAETAKILVEASLTGHLVLSTLHTNSAPESVVRLLDLGMDPFNFSDALLGVLAQRLVRKLCECKTAFTPSAAQLEELALEYCSDGGDAAKVLQTWRARQKGLILHRAKGCARCDRTGYKGRMGLYELLVADAAVKRLVQTRAPVSEIAVAAAANGMRTLKQDGIDKVVRGLTDLQQVRTV